MSSRRSQLFISLRLFFWADVVLFIVLVSWFVYLRYQRSKLLEVVERQLAFNIRLSSDLSYATDFITNTYFSAASSFVTNFVSSLSSAASPSFPYSPSSFSSPSSLSSSVDSSIMPPVSFNGYFELDHVPYIQVRRKCYTVGDILLGYPIEGISPDVVEYRGKYWKVDPDSQFIIEAKKQ